MKPIKIVQLPFDELEAHLFGEYVAVLFRLKKVPIKIDGKDGKKYDATVWERQTGPYINFVNIRQERNGDKNYYNDEDNVGRGGMDGVTAYKLASELENAAEYLNSEIYEDGE